MLNVTYFIFYIFFYLHRCGENIFTNKFSSSSIYRYFNSSVRRVKILFPMTRSADRIQNFSLHIKFAQRQI